MRIGSKRQNLYTNSLKKAMIKHSEGKMPENEAAVGAREITKLLIREGDSLDLKTVHTTAKWVVRQHTRVEDGELVYIPGVGVQDNTSGELHKA